MSKNNVNSFKDHEGKTGIVGSLVYGWMLELGGEVSIERKIEESKKVERIFTRGAAGTQLVLSGERATRTAKKMIIFELPQSEIEIEEEEDENLVSCSVCGELCDEGDINMDAEMDICTACERVS